MNHPSTPILEIHVETDPAGTVALAPILHRNQFVGESLRDKKGLCIRFYKLGDDK